MLPNLISLCVLGETWTSSKSTSNFSQCSQSFDITSIQLEANKMEFSLFWSIQPSFFKLVAGILLEPWNSCPPPASELILFANHQRQGGTYQCPTAPSWQHPEGAEHDAGSGGQFFPFWEICLWIVCLFFSVHQFIHWDCACFKIDLNSVNVQLHNVFAFIFFIYAQLLSSLYVYICGFV